jgi:UDP-N-acetylglucosamine:LPS N-acetylglucosamine transferase
LAEILAHPPCLSERAAAAKALGHADAAERLADLAEHLAEGGPS